MFTTDGLLKFHSWAQESFSALFAHAAKLPAEAWTREIAGFGMPSVRDQLVHISEAEAFWVASIQGLEFPGWDNASFTCAADVKAAHAKVVTRTREYIGSLNSYDLLNVREINFSEGGSRLISPALMLHHVITHGFHHKGQVVAMCRLLGYPPPETDLDLVQE